MKTILCVSTIVAAGLMPLSMASAQQADDATPPPTAAQPAMPDNGSAQTTKPGDAPVLSNDDVDKLRDRDVVNMAGETVGEVGDVVIAADSRMPFAVLQVGGFLGIGQTAVVVPLDQLRIERDEAAGDVLLLSRLSQDELKQMPPYDKTKYLPYDPAQASRDN